MWNQIFIPIEPVAKGRPRFLKNGHTYTPEKTRNFEERVAWFLKTHWKESPLSGPIAVEIEFFLRPPKRMKSGWPVVKPDADNLIKGICDSANGILWHDDKQIVDAHSIKIYDFTTRKVGIDLRFKILEESTKHK